MGNNQSAPTTSSRLNIDSSATSSNRVIPGQEDLYQKYKEAIVKTNYGDITVEFYGDDSPITVNNFMNLASDGFYNNTRFHRVIEDFMIQGGDPNSKGKDVSSYGTGGPGYKFDDEFNNHKLVRGSLAMANSGPNTNGSQFFIVTKEATPWLDGVHTNFGRVISGMKVADKIESLETNESGLPAKDVIIKSIELK
ncbi:peptidylprolyl isomerase [Candidatus Falkowbacteria bacterium CG_4_10_14_0_2_um_filter_41_15]|uniref:Peptidyl-prolyl cis-trans isomerase n=2 Tax=Candidatus Falkowiibacteriota TaxID=1752728 RepID=A0A2M7RY32_9BACT|nr:MAG: peptidylprolyl isomerase [Candidatus Falkowbacteria bacterium CG_4_10_14_0_8_um_filter_41_36]PJA09966.1 MAG: peptidylprolyl isomerase [Candidatus Falkowbacteria bacterium CG_4_10_14_0_2_um_filter_41_15]